MDGIRIKKIITIRKLRQDEGDKDVYPHLKVKSVAKMLITIAFLIAIVILWEDLDYVLNSDGIWSIFGEKLLIAFVALVAFIATINGKIGINTQWMHDYFIVLNLTELNNLTAKIAKWIAILLVLLGLFIAGKILMDNRDKIKNYFVERIDYYTSSKSQYIVNQIAREYAQKEPHKTDLNTTMYNENWHLCAPIDKTITSNIRALMKAGIGDGFISLEKERENVTDEIIWEKVGKERYQSIDNGAERIIVLMDNNRVLVTDINASYVLSCYEYMKANI